MTDHVCVQARFYFWDGRIGYTVEYGYHSHIWYVFNAHETSLAVFRKEVKPTTPNKTRAAIILDEYLRTLPVAEK